MKAGGTAPGRPGGRSAALKVLGAAALVALLIVGLKVAFRGPAPGTVTGDPMAIRLVGVRPDGGDAVYDAAGRKVGEDIGTANGPATWQPSQQFREFIFELPSGGGPLAFLPIPSRLRPVSSAQTLSAGGYPLQAERDGRRRLYVNVTFPRTYRMRLLRFFSVDAAVDAVDLTLRYYAGERGPAEVTFTGPFRPGVAVQADGGLAYTLTPAADQPEWLRAEGAQLHLSTALAFDDVERVLAYDRSGGRRVVQSRSGSYGGRGAEVNLVFPGLDLSHIAAVTLGEVPRERTFHNIRVAYRELPRRAHSACLDEVAKRLGLPPVVSDPQGGTSWGALLRIEGPDEAVKVIDAVRGYLIVRAAEQLRTGKFDPASLDAETRQRIRRAARSWLESFDPRIRVAGVEVGLRCGWHEFVEPALEMVRTEHGDAQRTAAEALQHRSGVLEAGDFRSIADLLLKEPGAATAYSLMMCLRMHAGTPAAAEQLLRLAGSDRVWLWWPAIERLCAIHPPAYTRLLEQARTSDALHARIIMVVGAGRLPGESLPIINAAYGGLPGLLSPALLRTDPTVFRELLRRMDIRTDHRTAAAGVVAFLAQMLDQADRPSDDGLHRGNWWPTEVCVEYLNLWFGQHIAGLGTDVNHETDSTTAPDWRDVARRAVDWYRDARASLPAPQGPENPARAVLPNGVVVELAAVGDYPSKGARWWRPDGRPLAGPPDLAPGVWPLHEESAEGLPAGRPFQMALKLTNWGPQGTHDYLKVTPGAMVTGKGLNGEEFLVGVGVVPPGTETCTVSIGLYPDPWTTLAESDGAREVRVQGPEGESVIGVPQAEEGGLSLKASTSMPEGRYQLVAVWRTSSAERPNREQHSSRGQLRPLPSGGEEMTVFFRDLRPEDVESFKLQARPVRRVVFGNVSMVPGRATQVEVSGEGLEAASE